MRKNSFGPVFGMLAPKCWSKNTTFNLVHDTFVIHIYQVYSACQFGIFHFITWNIIESDQPPGVICTNSQHGCLSKLSKVDNYDMLL